jgi:hypothetical protein
MPVTARLSRRFYERFGDDIVNELVEWLNQVDAAYRSDLREQNEMNFARFDARLREQNETTFARFDARLEQRLAELKGELRGEIAGLRGELRAELAGLKAELIKWMFLFWAGTALAGLLTR